MLSSTIVEQLVALERDSERETDEELRYQVPVSYSESRWHSLLAYLRDDRTIDENSSLRLLVRLLDAENEWILYQTLCALWRVTFGIRDVTEIGIQLAKHHKIQKPLIRLLKHRNHTLVLAANGLIVTLLRGLDAQYGMSYIDEGICGPLKQLILYGNSPTLVEKTINLMGWLACCGRECQEALIKNGMLAVLIPLLSVTDNATLHGVAWMSISWLSYIQSGKQYFIEQGGIHILLTELRKPIVRCESIFVVRKLAMHPPSQRVLLEAQVVPLLLQKAEGNDVTMRLHFVIAMALSFMVLNIPMTHPYICEAHTYISKTVETLELDQNLNVVYVTLADHKQLILNASSVAQFFGLWWISHLQVGEASGHYKRKNYNRMIVDEGLVPRIAYLLRSNSPDIARLAAAIVAKLAQVPSMQLQLIDDGVLWHLLQIPSTIATPVERSTILTVICCHLINFASDRDNMVSRNEEKVSSLKSTCESFLLRHVGDENVIALVHVAYAIRLPRLQAFCVGELSLDEPLFLENNDDYLQLRSDIRANISWVRECFRWFDAHVGCHSLTAAPKEEEGENGRGNV